MSSDDCAYVLLILFCTVLLFQMEQFKCSECPAVFTAKKSLLRHMKSQHTDERPSVVCEDCGATFIRIDNLRSHIKDKHSDAIPNFLCEKCGLTFARSAYLKKHRCDTVSVRKDARKRRDEKKAEREAKRRRNNESQSPPPIEIVEDEIEGEEVDNIISSFEEECVREVYRNHWTSLRTHYREGPNLSHYTFRWLVETEPCWEQWLRSVFRRQDKRFKLSLSHSFILFNIEENEFHFFFTPQKITPGYGINQG